MTLEWVEHILNEEWVEGAEGDNPGIDGRTHPVPKPTIDIQKDRSKIRKRTNDHINIVDGGTETHSPMGLQYTHEEVTTPVNIEIRTTHRPPEPPDVERPGRTRFEGTRDENNNSEDYGGLRGEVKRILDLYRLGHREYDLIPIASWSDDSGMAGKNNYLGIWQIELEKRASEVNPPDPLSDGA